MSERDPIFVTGASRGIGAATVVELAGRGHDVGIGVLSKLRRANKVISTIQSQDNDIRTEVFQGDLTNPSDLDRVIEEVNEWAPFLGGVILNAAGGLEDDKDEGYALRINRDSQVNLTKALMDRILPGGKVVYVTSDWSHLYGKKPTIPLPPFDYEAVASSKRAGEDALLDLTPELSERDIRLIIVTGGMVTGTYVGDESMKRFPDFAEEQRSIGGYSNVVSAEKMGAAIANVIDDNSLPSGHVVSVGAPLSALIEHSQLTQAKT